jgi:SNF2 family DNA or RNA helicase
MIQARVINGHLVAPLAGAGQLFPEHRRAQVDGQEWVAVPHTLEACRVLTNLGVRCPSPIRSQYSWPGRYTPLPHQRATAEFLTLNRRAFVLNGMGTMKTMSTLWAADYLIEVGVIKRALIVAPLSTLERVWGDEIFLSFPRRSFAVLHGDRTKRRALFRESHHFYIVNPDGIHTVADMLGRRDDIDLVIIDEVAEYRNAQTDKWKRMNAILTPARWGWGLTGAPTPQAPTDAYAQVKLLRPEAVANLSFTRFRMATMSQYGTFQWVAKPDAQEQVFNLMQPSIRFRKADVIDLPPTTVQERECALSPEQRRHYVKLVKESVTEIQSTAVTAVNAGVLLGKLVQAATGVVYGQGGEFLRIDAGPRIRVVEEVVEESEGKVIVFVPFTGALQMLAEHLSKRWSVDIVDGSVGETKRNRIFQAFQQDTHPHVLIAHPRTMAHGLNLTAATTIVWYAPYASHAIYEQACERVARPGQTRGTAIIHLSGTPVERKIYKALRDRRQMQSVLLDMVELDTRKLLV